MSNLRTLVIVVAAIAAAFFFGRCSKKPTNVEKVVEKKVYVYPDSIPMPEPVILEKVRYIVDKTEVRRLKGELDLCSDSLGVYAVLLAAKDILGEITVVHDTITDSVYVEVSPKSYSDTQVGENYTVDWDATVTGRLDALMLNVDVECQDCPVARDKSFGFGFGLKTNSGFNVDVPLSISHEKGGFEKGLTYYPFEKAVSVDFKFRPKYSKLRLNPFKRR